MLTLQDLQGLRTNPANFLLNNIIFTPIGDSIPGPAIHTLSFAESGYTTAVGYESAAITDGNDFQAYFLPWGRDASLHVNLGLTQADPDIMLTGRLTGCAIGSQLPPGQDFIVHHCNILNPDGSTDVDAQRETLQQVGATVNINKQNYKLSDVNYAEFDNDKSANVVGVRRNNVWELYAQFLQSDLNALITVTQVTQLV